MEYRKRIVDKQLDFKLEAFGAKLIEGPKGCGKTTTAKQKAKRVLSIICLRRRVLPNTLVKIPA